MAGEEGPQNVEIRNQKGELLATLKPGDRALRLETGSSMVDLRPLQRLESFEHIELVGDRRSGINSPRAILPDHLPGLQTLVVRGKVENPEVIPNFTELQKLIPGVFYWPVSLDFVERMPGLRHLEMTLQSIDDLTQLRTLEHLQVLHMWNSWRCDLAPLGGMTQLEELHIDGYRKGLQHVRGLVKLHTFGLYEGHSKHLNMLRDLHRLRVLAVSGGVSDVSVLHELPQLEQLYLRATQVDNQAIMALEAVPRLTKLSLMQGDRVTDIGPVGTLRQLRDLDLIMMKGPLRTLAPLASLTELEVLQLAGTEVADRDVSPILTLTRLKDLWVGVYSDEEESEFRRRFPQAWIYRAPGEDEYLQLGDVRVWKPNPDLPRFWISQDLTSALKVPEQAEAEERIARAFKAKHPTLAAAVEYDSEGSAFVANAKSEEVIRALADVINRLIGGKPMLG